MKFITYLLIYSYALVMSISAVLLGKEQTIPLWLIVANGFASVLLSCAPFSQRFLYVGISLLFLCALINGYELNGHIRWTHAIIRISISLLIIYLYHKNISE